jgi:hypothetical protein
MSAVDAPLGHGLPMEAQRMLVLQRSIGNRAVNRLLSGHPRGTVPLADLRSAMPGVVVQRAIEPENKTYVADGQRVVDSEGKEGTIVEIQGTGYAVKFDIGVTYYVSADDLDVVSVASTSVTPVIDGGADLEATPDYQPHQLVAEQQRDGKKKLKTWNLHFENVSKQRLGSVLDVQQGTVKGLLNKNTVFTNSTKDPKDGQAYILVTGAEQKAPLQAYFDPARKAHQDKARLEQMQAARLAQATEGGADAPTQKTVFNRLNELYEDFSRRKNNTAGHETVQMLGIKLDSKPTIMVGGEARKISYLYSQVGNATERRCYLGTEGAVYQRVHTSITVGDKVGDIYAHTMVQTSKAVAVPQVRGGGAERVGYDSKEGERNGFGNRALTGRSKEQSKVEGWIKGLEVGNLKEDEAEGALLLAMRFNATLDRAIADIMGGNAADRTMSRLPPNFAILDDDWVFSSGSATPAEEVQHEKSKK